MLLFSATISGCPGLLFRYGRKLKDPQEIFDRLGKYVAALHELLAAKNGARAFVAILRYLESITPRSRGDVVKALQKTMRISEEQYNYIAFGDEYIHEKGVEKGRAEGRVEGRREAVLLLLGDRFGRLPTWVVEVVKEAPTSRLTGIMRRILRAATLPEVLGTNEAKAKRKAAK